MPARFPIFRPPPPRQDRVQCTRGGAAAGEAFPGGAQLAGQREGGGRGRDVALAAGDDERLHVGRLRRQRGGVDVDL